MEPIFFDFEADLEHKVYLLSYRIDDQTTTYVCDEALMGIALIFGLRTAKPEVACKNSLRLARIQVDHWPAIRPSTQPFLANCVRGSAFPISICSYWRNAG
jgi:hypothetical protein